MFKNKKILALIPARGGSKGMPKKNIKSFCGKPLFAWTIEQAKASCYIDRCVVTTDNKKIASLAVKYGAHVPFLRPKNLAADKSAVIAAICHALGRLKAEGEFYDLILLLQPTSPLRLPKDIDKAIEELFFKNARAVVSVCEAEHHPYWANALPKNLSMRDFISPEIKNKNRQELPKFYRLNGAIYLAYYDYLAKNKGFLGPQTFAYIMDKERSVDIDCEMDFKTAELFFKNANSFSSLR